MSEKDLIITWNEAVELFKSKPDDPSCTREAAERLETLISSSQQQGISKLCYNVAVLRRSLGDKSTALRYLHTCLEKDPHNAMAYYQRATLLYELDQFAESAKDFQKCIECMRQATVIDYTQLGLRCKLFQHEAIFNEAACHLKLRSRKNCMDALLEVKSLMEKNGGAALRTLDIEQSLRSVQDGARTIDIIVRGQDKLYTPPLAKLNNLAKKNYLGKAKVVSSVQTGDTFAGFVGPKICPPERPESPRAGESAAGTPKTGMKPLLEDLIAKQTIIGGAPNRPSLPMPPRPVAAPRAPPTPSPASPEAKSTHTVIHNRAQGPKATPVSPSGKPATAVKPTLCKVEVRAGDSVEVVHISTNSNYLKMLDTVKKAFGYDDGTFSLWYLNRQGTYTAIDSQDVVDHVWKWKVQDNQLTIYIFGL